MCEKAQVATRRLGAPGAKALRGFIADLEVADDFADLPYVIFHTDQYSGIFELSDGILVHCSMEKPSAASVGPVSVRIDKVRISSEVD